MRILHISKYYFPYIGGVENICKYLVEGMPQYQTAVLCFNEKNKNTIDVVNGIKIYRVATWINIARQALSLSYFPMMKRAIKEFNPNIIHFHWANPFPAAVLLTMIPNDVKLIVHWHMDIIKQKKIYPFIKPIETALLKRANRIIVTSPNYKKYSLPLQPFLSKVDIVPNAIDETKLLKQKNDLDRIEQIKHLYNNKDIIFFVGRHIQYKGLPWLIDAERMVKSDCVFIIAGKGPLTKELKEKCKSDRVYFVGKLSDDDLRCYLYAAKIFAFPSITKNEAFGVALAEAMYCGTPPITFTIEGSGVNWVSLNGQTGLEVPNKDSNAYAIAIDKLLNDKLLYERFSTNGKNRVKNMFTLDKMLKACENCYKHI